MPVTRSQARSSAGHQLGDGQDPAQHSKGTSNLDKNPRQTTQSASKTSSNDASDHKVLQTGIVRFYTRGRMNIENPTEADEVARLYMVLDRALPASPHHPRPSLQGDDCCMLLIPKKTLPQKPGDRRMAFVDAPQTSLVALEKTLSFSDEHETKTAGLQHTPKAHMLGRGVYAIVASQKETLFGYVLTAPVDMVSEQNEADLDTSGTFIVSTRNPRFAAPKSVQLPKSPEYPKHVLKDFGHLRWAMLQATHLNYTNTQILLVGRHRHGQTSLPDDVEDYVQRYWQHFEYVDTLRAVLSSLVES